MPANVTTAAFDSASPVSAPLVSGSLDSTSLDWASLGLAGLVVLGAFLVMWGIQVKTRDAGIVDFGWAASIGALAVWAGLTSDGSSIQRGLGAALGGAWGFRLAYHLLTDRVLAGEEDGRYRYLRAHWGDRANAHFLWFFAAQAVLATAMAIPFWAIAQDRSEALSLVQWIGLAVSVAGVCGVAIADRQLARFRADGQNKGKTCRVGLWRFSRHPNYFFEWVTWCGFGLVAYASPLGAWAALLPVVMYVFLTRLTGIPYTEAQALRSRGDDYREYQRTTSAFFPMPPSSGATS